MPIMDYGQTTSSSSIVMPKEDQRIELMREYVNIEREKRRAEEEAKTASVRAAEMSDEFARVRAQLHEVLGVSDVQSEMRREGY